VTEVRRDRLHLRRRQRARIGDHRARVTASTADAAAPEHRPQLHLWHDSIVAPRLDFF
jgi:hypothetical protein